MALNNSQYDTIIRAYEQKQLHNRNVLDKRYKTVYNRLPELKEINDSISLLSVNHARKLLDGDESALPALKEEIRKLSEQKKTLLLSAGFPADYLEPVYECEDCKDTGYIGNRKCHCFHKAVIDLLYTQSNLQHILEKENFDTFSLSYYSDNHIDPKTGRSSLTNMKNAYLTCREFAHAYSVIYFTAFELFDTIAKSKFEKDNTAEIMYEHIFNCDLLIIDDLGTELSNAFTVSQLFLCLNERLLRRKSTIISTNLSLESLVEIYSERTFSRITSNYTMLKLTGDDIRIKKKLMNREAN